MQRQKLTMPELPCRRGVCCGGGGGASVAPFLPLGLGWGTLEGERGEAVTLLGEDLTCDEGVDDLEEDLGVGVLTGDVGLTRGDPMTPFLCLGEALTPSLCCGEPIIPFCCLDDLGVPFFCCGEDRLDLCCGDEEEELVTLAGTLLGEAVGVEVLEEREDEGVGCLLCFTTPRLAGVGCFLGDI
ncbi:hypothetical protein E2C01_029204 [Portunus trituberculatus]|uniref:Uncharacterized protein n=1 Tax=Portunus trituberculatus TaxID=210409 RepID=A0A5B7ERM1_PORTR|nr:hypothetical protein [Portunus trituberculatus]